MMLTKAKIAFIKSLADRKGRREAGLFVAEGAKLVDALLRSRIEIAELYAVADWLNAADVPAGIAVAEIGAKDLDRISGLTTPNQVLALAAIPSVEFDAAALRGKLILGLEDLQDPGNLGAIVRACDWFGIDDVVASAATADCFNPKVVQASMGSIARVAVHYRDDLGETIRMLRDMGKPIYGTTPDGADIYRVRLSADALVLFGNEGKGLSRETIESCGQRIGIPSFRAGAAADSLNVAMAASIVCGEFRRR